MAALPRVRYRVRFRIAPQTDDVACGSGHLAGFADAQGASVEGLDFSPRMIAAARKRFPGLSFQVGDAEALPFPDDAFDAVVIGFCVHHFPFPIRALSEARRVLRPEGPGLHRMGTGAPPHRPKAYRGRRS